MNTTHLLKGKSKSWLSVFIFVCFSSAFSFAQQSANNSSIYNTWYEWPHENSNGNTVYKTVKYVPVPGIDKQDEPFGKLIISANGNLIKTQYCGYCPNLKITENKNKAELISNNGIITGLKIKNAQKTSVIKVLSLEKDKLTLAFEPEK